MALAALIAGALGCGRSELRVGPPPPEPSCGVRDGWQRVFPGRAFTAAAPLADGWVALGPVASLGDKTSVMRIAADGAVAWERALDQRQSALSVASGAVTVAGSVGGSPDVEVMGLGDGGAPQWTAKVATPDEDHAQALLDDQGALVLVGTASKYGPAAMKALVARLHPGGAIDWQQTFAAQGKPGDLFPPEELPFGAFAAAGRVVVGARRWLNGGGGPPAVFALDRQGAIAWQHDETIEYERGGGWLLLPTRDGGSLMVGMPRTGPTQGPSRAVRLDAAGQVVWARSLDDGSSDQELVMDGIELPNGELVLAGYSAHSVSGEVWRLDAAGEILAREAYPEARNGIVRVVAMPGGYLLASSPFASAGGGYRGSFVLLRVGAGGIAWRREITRDGMAAIGEVLVGERTILVAGHFYPNQQMEGVLVALTEECASR